MRDWDEEISQWLLQTRPEPAREAELVTELVQRLDERYDTLRRQGASHAEAYRAVLTELQDGRLLAAVKEQRPLHLWLIALVGVIVPQRLRADWRQEWEAELRYRETMLAEWDKLNLQNKLDLLRRSAGACKDALLLQPQRWEDEMIQDSRFALRMLRKHKGFTAIALLTFMLGIGANTAIFSFFSGILLRPLPYAAPENIVIFKKSPQDFSEPKGTEIGVLAADFRELQTQTQALAEMASYSLDVATLRGRGTPDLAACAIVTHNFFSVLGASATLGRTFAGNEANGAAGRLAVLSHAYWQSRLSGDPVIVGQTITLNQVAFTIIGVMPPEFDFPREANIWVTPAGLIPESVIGQAPIAFGGRGNYLRTIIGRLRPGVTCAQAQTELAGLVERLPNPNEIKRSVQLVNMREQSLGNVRPALVMLLGCVGLVLLIACFNVANLSLSRATARQREIGIRLALGATRWRIARQLLTESIVLALLGGILGTLLSGALLKLLVRFAPEDIPRLTAVQLDNRVLGFAVLVSLLAGLLSGLAPVLGTVKADLVSAVKSGARGGTADATARRLRTSLVIGEVALSLMLLVAAGLLLRSFGKMQEFDWGFKAANVVTMRVAFLDESYRPDAARRTFLKSLLQKLEAVPGFESVGVSLDRIGETWIHLPFTPEGQVYPNATDRPQTSYHIVSHDYLQTLRIPLQQGRAFTAMDNENSRRVVIVDAALANRFFPAGQAVGKHIQLSAFGDGEWAEIVGVTAAVKSDGPAAEPRTDIYLPFLQAPVDSFFVHVRTPLEVAAVGAMIEKNVHAIDAGLPLFGLANMETVTALPADARRFPLGLLGIFALLALLLATVGIYGVIAYSVALRTREIGIRLALGAPTSAVLWMILGQGFKLILCGLGCGALGAFLLKSYIAAQLFGISASDPLTYIAVALVLASVGLFACWLPARQATRVDPMIALQHD